MTIAITDQIYCEYVTEGRCGGNKQFSTVFSTGMLRKRFRTIGLALHLRNEVYVNTLYISVYIIYVRL